MASQSDIDYFSARAIIEREHAEDATTPEIARVHDQLARRYEELVKSGQAHAQAKARPTLRIASPDTKRQV